jgi:AraC-like DNA-binding protein
VIELLRVRKDDLSMKFSLKELAKEVGVTPSYLCRVFKKTMGITVGTYLTEFEKQSSDDETEGSASNLSQIESDMGSRTELTLPTIEDSQVAFNDLQAGESKQEIGNIAEALDLNFNFDECSAGIDDLFWTEEYWIGDSWNAGLRNEGSLY